MCVNNVERMRVDILRRVGWAACYLWEIIHVPGPTATQRLVCVLHTPTASASFAHDPGSIIHRHS